MKRLFNENVNNFKFNFPSRGQLGSLSIDDFFFYSKCHTRSIFFDNFIFARIARMFSGNRHKIQTRRPKFTKVNKP